MDRNKKKKNKRNREKIGAFNLIISVYHQREREVAREMKSILESFVRFFVFSKVTFCFFLKTFYKKKKYYRTTRLLEKIYPIYKYIFTNEKLFSRDHYRFRQICYSIFFSCSVIFKIKIFRTFKILKKETLLLFNKS